MSKTQWIGNLRDLCPGEERGAMVDKIHAAVTKGKKAVPKGAAPHLILTIGPPGAGKSTLARELAKHTSDWPLESYVELDFDDLLDYLPAGGRIRNVPGMDGKPSGVGAAYGWDACIGHTSAAAGEVYERVLEGRYNLILNAHWQRALISAQLRGYVCTLFYVAITMESALERAGARALELGRFLEPATEQNGWGWEASVRQMWGDYRGVAPWYASWADNFAIVVNERKGKLPEKGDYKLYNPHPALEPGQSWVAPVAGLHKAIGDAHEEAEAIRKAKKK